MHLKILCIFWLFVCTFEVSAQTVTLPYRPITAEYSNSLDRIIFIASNPNQLHIFDPLTSSDTAVNLPKPPLSLSVSLDGLHAAVGHDALISYINLRTASLEATLTATVTVNSLVLGSNYVYVLTYSGGTQSINISTGAIASNGVYNGTTGRLHPSGTALYTTDDGLSPEQLQDFDVSTGPVTTGYGGPYFGDYPVCGGVWFSPDGRRVYTGCAAVYQAAPQDKNADELYWTTLAGTNFIRSLTESAMLGRVAAIPFSYPNTSQVNDNQVFLYDSAYLEPAGTLQLPDFIVLGKGYQAHGQQVFYNQASTALYVVMQADGSSGLLNDFAVQVFPLSNQGVCSPAFNAASATVPASGTVATVDITADAACLYQASSNAPWLQLVSGAYGSGNGTLAYVARPNSGGVRTGTITLDSQSFTVTQAAAAPARALTQLGYSVAGADYSKALDRVVLIVSNPHELHVYDPVSGSDQIVPLPKTPFCISVAPDGLSAAVGYDGWVSIVNLSTGAITSTIQVFSDVHTILLAGNGYFYAYPLRTTGNLLSVQISTGTIYSVSAIYEGRFPRLYADGNSFYTEFSKWDITQGPARIINEYNISTGGCAPFWLTEDGDRMITACGKAYTTSNVPALDLQYNGSFANAASIQWAAESAKSHSTALIPSVGASGAADADSYLQIYGDVYLGYAGALSLPSFLIASTPYAGHGRYVFWNSAEDKLIVLEQADATAALSADYGVTVYSPAMLAAGCSYILGARSASFDNNGGPNSVSVTTGPGCLWEGDSTAPWITVDSGGVGFGTNSVNYGVAPNLGASARTGAIIMGGQTFTINQAGTAGAGTATHFSVTAPSVAVAGIPVVFTVTALDASNNPVTTYSNPVHFATTDGSATVPVDGILNETGTFSATLVTTGTQTITASDFFSSSIAGTSPGITVSAASGLRYVPMTPCRVVDTRNPTGPFGGPFIFGGGSRSFAIPNSTDCVIPSTAQAYSLNVTVVPHGSLGYLTIWPTGQSRPVVSTLNSLDGRVKANASIVPAGSGGAITVFATNDTDVVLDIGGYFVPATNSSAVAFYPMTPCRLVDTRPNAPSTVSSGVLTGGTSRTLPILSSGCNVPAMAQAYALNFTVVPQGPLGYLTVSPTGVSRPVVSTLNAPTGTVVANAAIVPRGTAGSIDVYATDTTDLVVDIDGYFAPAGPGGLSLYALPPCRSLDTRTPSGAPPFSGTLDINVIGSACGGTGAAQAYVLNATSAPLGPLGYLTLWPQGGPQPLVSTLNALDGSITSNMAIVPTSNIGISAYATNNSYLILDMSGYFAP